MPWAAAHSRTAAGLGPVRGTGRFRFRADAERSALTRRPCSTNSSTPSAKPRRSSYSGRSRNSPHPTRKRRSRQPSRRQGRQPMSRMFDAPLSSSQDHSRSRSAYGQRSTPPTRHASGPISSSTSKVTAIANTAKASHRLVRNRRCRRLTAAIPGSVSGWQGSAGDSDKTSARSACLARSRSGSPGADELRVGRRRRRRSERQQKATLLLTQVDALRDLSSSLAHDDAT